MWDNPPPDEFVDNIFQLVAASVNEIHASQNIGSYMEWIKTNYKSFLPPTEKSLPLALFIARSIWNITPLSSNRYRPSPLPELKRNSACFCGSGKKFKHCCLNIFSAIPPFEPYYIWLILIENMKSEELKEALSLQVVPTSAILSLVEQYAEDNRFLDIIEVLKPIFTLPQNKMGEEEGIALTFLCNAYDDLKQPKSKIQKIELLNNLKNQGSKLIRSEAWQRLATIYLDEGKEKKAWKAFQAAQRLTPNSFSVDLLEINLLLGESKDDLAQQRAKIILRKTERNGDYEDSPIKDFLRAVAEDPKKVAEEMFSGRDSFQIDRLEKWLHSVSGRRLPIYKLESFIADNHWMQEESTQGNQVDLFPEDINNKIPESLEKEQRLITPKSILKLEKQWSQLINKWEGSFPWDEAEWLVFLKENPQCFGSAEIIDDLLTALEEWQQDERLLLNICLPLSKRAWEIYDSLPEQGAMPWGFMENRPLYSALFSIIHILKHLGRNDEAMQYAKRLIKINPNDNHAVRAELINYYLTQKAYDKALELAHLYPQDILLEIRMANVLSLWALGQKDKALEYWQQIKERNSHIKKYMTSSTASPPKLDAYGVTMGGKDEAWLYCEAMRDTWLTHRGLITWLKQN